MKTYGNSKYNTHGCTMLVTVDEEGRVVSSVGCSWSGHNFCLPDGWADGSLVRVTGPEPEDGDWEIILGPREAA